MSQAAISQIPDARLRRARAATLVAVAAIVFSDLALPAVGLASEQRTPWIVLGAAGILAFAAAHAVAIHAAVTPSLPLARRRRALIWCAAAAVASLGLVAPVGTAQWQTWAWIGGSIIGSAPLMLDGRWAAATIAVTALAVVGVALATGGSVTAYVLIALFLALTIVAMCVLPAWLLGLLGEVQEARAAHVRLATAEQRLRFARDVHDVLGHHLTVIALKGELAARLADTDPTRAAQEAEDVRRLAATALTEVRQAVTGYRAVNLGEEVDAIEQVMRSCGVRCSVAGRADALPADAAQVLAAVLREASTNVLRHSHARWCSIELGRAGGEAQLRVSNDGVVERAPDTASSGLRGLGERLAAAGGRLDTSERDGVFTLEAAIAIPT